MAGVLDALKAMQVAENQQRAREARAAKEQAYNEALSAGKAIGAASVVAPPGIASAAITGMGLLNDQKIAKMEEDDPSLNKNPFNPGRFSTVGQILGYGYRNQPGIPQTSIWDRLRNALGGGDGAPDPNKNIWNARGIPMTVVQPSYGAPVSSSGWESGDGGDSPAAAKGTTNYGGRESMVDDTDRSGYA